jgi:ABC-type transport system substrate-binding protein
MVNGPEGPLLDLDADRWDRIDWRACEETVRRLRGRIFTAAKEQDWPKVRNLQKRTDLEGRFVSRPVLIIQTVRFPLYDPRYANPDLRRALSMAINREQINKQIFSGTRPPLTVWSRRTSPVAPGTSAASCASFAPRRPSGCSTAPVSPVRSSSPRTSMQATRSG